MEQTKKEIYTEKFSKYIHEHYSNKYEIVNIPDNINFDRKIVLKCNLHNTMFNMSWAVFKRGCIACKECETLKTEQTCLKKYGVKNPKQSIEVKEKINKMHLTKYGCKYYTEKFENFIASNYNNNYKLVTLPKDCKARTKVTLQCITHDKFFDISWNNFSKGKIGCETCKSEKYKKTMQKNYGVDNYSQTDEFSIKYKTTCLKRYGVEFYTKSDDYIEKTKQTYMDKYGVEFFVETDLFKEKSKITSLINHGVEHHQQSHINNTHLEILNNKEQLEELLNTNTFEEIAINFNIHPSTVANYARKHNILLPRSSYENSIAHFLNKSDIDFMFNTFSIISPYQLDFYIPDHNLAIEYGGIYWHAENKRERITVDYHKMKYDRCKKLGITLITIFGDEWNEDTQNKILYHCDLIANHWLPNMNTIIADLRFGEDKILEDMGYTKIEENDPEILEEYQHLGYNVYDCGKIKYTI